MSENIHARVIVEMLGKPKDYIDATLKKYVDKFAQKYEIVKRDFAEPEEQDGGAFSVFVELEIVFKKVQEMFDFLLDAMPSSIEIVDPESLEFSAVHLADFLNDIQSKLHETDMMAKTLASQNKNLDRNATNIFNNFILHLCGKSPQTLEAMSPIVGVKPEGLKKFMDQLVSQKKVVLGEDGYKAI